MTTNTVKHTPGPWQAVGWKPCGIYGPGGMADAERICTMDDRQEHDANARLIAAAPDLLEVAQRILDRGYVSESIEEERDDHLALVAAISKATGSPAPQEKGGE